MLRFSLMLVLAIALALSPAAMAAAKKTPAPLTKVTFVTDWKAQAEHGGFYQAVADGLYAQRGLDVKIIQGGPSVNVPQLLAGGAADFGMGSNSFIPLNMVRSGVPITAVMAIFQKDPQVLITHPRRDMNSIADMRGKPVLISAATMTAFWPWLRAKFGFSDKQIRKYTHNLAPFIRDPNAIQEGYLTSEPYTIEKQAGFKPKVFLLADFGYPGYANMVLVPQKRIDADRKTVQGFVDATRLGWQRYLANPAKGNALIKRDNPDMTDDILAQAIKQMRDRGMVEGGDAATLGIGAMTEARLKDFFDQMAANKVFDAKLDYRHAFNLSFVNKGHGVVVAPPAPATAKPSKPKPH
jgi:NitT/TauT family transport system substrate-binding protein